MNHQRNSASEGAVAGEPVVVLNRDLLFGSRIASTVRTLGYDPTFVPTTAAFCEAVRAATPALAIIDMNGQVDWPLVASLVEEVGGGTPLLAFGPHVDVNGRRAAKAAGVGRIVSNGDFHRQMAELIARYARPRQGAGDGKGG